MALNRFPDDDADGAAGAAKLPCDAGEETGHGLGLAGISSGEGGLRLIAHGLISQLQSKPVTEFHDCITKFGTVFACKYGIWLEIIHAYCLFFSPVRRRG